MTKSKKQLEEEIPDFLKRQPEPFDYEVLEKAYAFYLRETKKTPEQGSKETTSLLQLLPWLINLDPRWKEIPPE